MTVVFCNIVNDKLQVVTKWRYYKVLIAMICNIVAILW